MTMDNHAEFMAVFDNMSADVVSEMQQLKFPEESIAYMQKVIDM